MSFDAILWALKDAPTASSLERLVLVTLAERCARADGCTSFPSRDTIARTVHADPKTVQRVLRELESRGLIAKGDQSAARYLRADRRPVVWDLLIPYSWFPNPERMNAERVQAGLPPLTPADRPDIPPPPPRKKRSDAGKPRVKASAERGDSEPPRHGGTVNPARGDSESRTGGLEAPRTSPPDPPLGTSPSSSVAAAAGESPATPSASPEEGGGGGIASRQEEDLAAAAFIDSLPYAGRRPSLTQRKRMIELASRAFAQGWSVSALRIQLTSETESAKSLAAVYAHRLRPEILPPPPQPKPLVDAVAVVPLGPIPLQNCDGCDRAFRSPTPGLCRDCSTS